MNPLRIGLTGATSALGEIVLGAVSDLPASSILSFGRRVTNEGSVHLEFWTLGDRLSSTDFDFFFHLAFDRRNLGLSNLGTKRIALQIARESPDCRQVFFSSLSAFPRTKSRYGAAKYSLEKELLAQVDKVTIVRPGILLERNGMGGSFLRVIECSPVLPRDIDLFNIRTVSRDQLRTVVSDIATQRTVEKEINICSAKPFSDGDIFRFRRLPIVRVSMRLVVHLIELSLHVLPNQSVIRDQLRAMLANRYSPHVRPEEEQ